MAADQYRRLSPEAILATLRSLPRRYRSELTTDASLDAGTAASVARLIADSAARITAGADAVHRAAVLEHPSVTIDPAITTGAVSTDQALTALDAAVAHAAEVIDALPTSAWDRSAAVTGTGTHRTVLELAQDCAREGVEHLRQVTTLLDKSARDTRS
jgi:hypothetical protein